MSGGIGSRFWPYSRTARPKQFLDFFGSGRSLLQMTFDRMLPLVESPERIIVVTNDIYGSLVAEQLPELPAANILTEPTRRNTAPAVALAAYHILAVDPEASMVVVPSDNLITGEAVFNTTILNGFGFVENSNALLTVGLTATRPETRYGYIQVGAEATSGIARVKTFTEKPDAAMAEVFIDSGEFYWNSGIFLWKASSIVAALRQHAPELSAVFDSGIRLFGTPDEDAFISRAFPSCPSIAIDFAVLEHASNAYVAMANFGWSDLGTWGSLYDNSPKNRERNVTQECNVLAYNSSGNIFAVKSRDKLVVVSGLDDYIVADTDNVLLIYPRAEEQDIRRLVDDARQAFGDKYL